MRKDGRTLLTLEERLKLAAGSQAVSPETAVKLVQRFSQLHTACFFCGKADLTTMYELIGEFMEDQDLDIESYPGLCCALQRAILRDTELFCRQGEPQAELDHPYRPTWGVRADNALVLLGLMLLDHARGRRKDRDIYHCTRMTLKQYLEALEELSIRRVETPDQAWPMSFRAWKKSILLRYDGSGPLGDVQAHVIKRYIDGWQELDHVDHILRCMGALAYYLEREGEANESSRAFREVLCRYSSDLEGRELVGEDERYPDPGGYFFTLAYEYPDSAPDPDQGDDPGTLRSQIFLPRRDYRLDTLRALAAKSPSPDLRELLEKSISGEQLTLAMRKIDNAAVDLYMLWVEPYLWMEDPDAVRRNFSAL